MFVKRGRQHKKALLRNDKRQRWGTSAEVVSILYEESISPEVLVKGVKRFIEYWWIFVRQPFSFVRNINYNDPYVFRNAFVFFCYSITLYYILLLPVFVCHDQGIHRITFYLRTLIQYGVALLGLFLGLKIVGGKGSIKQTVSAAFFSSGFISPVSSILLLPAYFALGTDFMFGDTSDILIALMADNDRIIYWVLYFNLINGLGGIVFFIHYLRFSRVIHQINWLKSILAYIIGMGIALPLLAWIVNPALTRIFPYIEKAIDYIL